MSRDNGYVSVVSELTNKEAGEPPAPRDGDMGINDIFQALSDPTRREILRLLRRRDMSAGELAEQFPLAKSTLSGHFRLLRQAGLIVSEKRGTTIRYSLNVSAVEEAVGLVMDVLRVGKPRKGASS